MTMKNAAARPCGVRLHERPEAASDTRRNCAQAGSGAALAEFRGSLLDELRDGTIADHRRIEAHPLLRALTAPTLSLEHYARVLAAFTGFHEALDPRLVEMSAIIDFPHYLYRPRMPALVEDRAVLPVCAVTPCANAPEFSCVDEVLGVLYVLEGATQGGLVIAPLVQQRLALTERAGARYFNLHRQGGWQNFRALVEHCQQHCDHGLAVSAARATFEHLHAHLDRCLCGVEARP